MVVRYIFIILYLIVYCSPLLAGEPEGMVRVPGGTFWMGSDVGNKAMPRGTRKHEGPAHQVTVDGFWMDIYPVTNAQYTRFVKN
jgi:formylglycine-generating enzyme required for sulfatase activity